MIGAPLGSIANYVTPPLPDLKWKNGDFRARRYALANLAGELLPGERVSYCHKRFTKGEITVEIWKDSKLGRAHYKNLMTCGSIWVCPVCASKITERRRAELRKALDQNKSLTPIMVTFTFQHNRGMRLETSVEVLNDTYRRFQRGEPWTRFKAKWGIIASVTSLEVTWGAGNGWHAHKHGLFWSTLRPDELVEGEIKAWCVGRWAGILDRKGYYASELYGVDVQKGDKKAGDYVSKWGLDFEITKGHIKVCKNEKGYSPFALLEVYATGELWAGDLFKEYAKVMKGRRQMQWSNGGRDILGLDKLIKTDEELAAEVEPGSLLFAILYSDQWKAILGNDIRAEVLGVASKGDIVDLWLYLESFGIPVSVFQWEKALAFRGANWGAGYSVP